ncbi:hypothetical protein LR004_01865 [Candidatus Gracilibacteria bacterium]|nr:hypothetical protein [Candidatus Gracilibacteria bacterium]
MKKGKTAKAFAIFALLGIIISIVGTGILVLTTPSHQPELTPDALQDIINDSNVEVEEVTVENEEIVPTEEAAQ